MVDLDQHVLREAGHEGHSIATEELLFLIERYHSHGEPGIARDALEAYAEAVGADDRVSFTAKALLTVVESRLTDSRTWIERAFYEIAPDRISLFPAIWHDRLDGETDVLEYIRFIQSDESGYHGDSGDLHAAGVPKQLLIRAAAVFADEDARTVGQQIYDHRQQGELLAFPDQHPNADIRLPSQADDRG